MPHAILLIPLEIPCPQPPPPYFFIFLELPIEYPRHVHRAFKAPVTYREIILSIINGLIFIISFEKDYKYFNINFAGLQQEVFRF